VPNSENRELKEVSIAGLSVGASPAGAGAGVGTTATGATGASVFGVLGGLVALGADTGTGVGADSAAEEEAFFAIVVLYTLLCEVFLSIFRHYIL
jgi:hypothetical protein